MESPRPCKSILLVEDDADIRESLKELLELEGFSVLAAENGKEGLELFAKIEEPCLVLLDLMMPVMNGWEFLQAKKGNVFLAPIPVVVVSALEESGPVRDVRGYVKKPIQFPILLSMVRQFCGPATGRKAPDKSEQAA